MGARILNRRMVNPMDPWEFGEELPARRHYADEIDEINAEIARTKDLKKIPRLLAKRSEISQEAMRADKWSGRNPAPAVTDRALRYRANADPPAGPRVCAYCGSRRNVEIGHRDGHEENNSPRNLVWTCRACNTRMGIQAVNEGWGRRTRQYNAAVPTFTQYAMGASMHQRGAHDAGGAIIHATPKALRREYAKRIWSERKSRGTTSTRRRGGYDEVPF